MANGDAPAIDNESREMIEGDVKKKKPRKFFIVYKGTQIKCLGVFKKGPFGPRVLKAKKDGHKGEVCYGVVVGSGEKLTFQLPGSGEVAAAMKVDSFESDPPISDAKFRKFLKENELSFKPRFEIITSASAALDPEASDESGSGSQREQSTEFESRREQLEARLLAAKRAAPESSTKLGAAWDYAGEQAEAGATDKAITALDRLEQAIDKILSAPERSDAERFGIEEGIVEVTREKLIAQFEKSKLVWERTRNSIQDELKKLEQAILQQSQEEEDFDEIEANSDNVYVALDELDNELCEVLADAIQANSDSDRVKLHADAREVVQRYRDFLAEDPFLSEVDSNPFTSVKVRSTLETSLNALDKALQLKLVTS